MAELNGMRGQVFRPLPDVLRADAVADRLTTAIALGLIRQGEQLPVENELSQMFGVASATVRDALATLRDAGIIETRRGRSGGTFVTGSPSASQATLHERLIALSMAELRDLADEQTGVAVATVRLACERSMPRDIDRLATIAAGIGDQHTLEGSARADSKFHIQLAALTQSERLMQAEIRLQSETVEMLWSVLRTPEDRARAAAEHLAIAEAMRAEDIKGAESLASEHIRRNVYRLIDAKLDLTYPETAGKNA
ncbi:MAG: hypothetical protein RIS25_862 [Actinomycetota bacterium]|jgi:DNA-binding FadR family transcriptional regulator